MAARGIEMLTPREREVVALIAAGKTNVEIANELGIRFDTARWHVSEVLSKLSVERREEAGAAWRRWQRVDRRVFRAIGGGFGLGTAAKVGGGVAASVVVVAAVALIFALSDDDNGSASPGRILVAQVVRVESGPTLTVLEAGVKEPLLQITPGAVLMGLPRFSPDGSKVAVVIAMGDEGHPSLSRIASFDVATGTIQLSDPIPVAAVSEPRWSPDGTRMATASGELVVFDASATRLSPQPDDSESLGSAYYPMWSPNSQHVATMNPGGGSILLGTPAGQVREIDADQLSEQPPNGVGSNPDLDYLGYVDWAQGGRLRLRLHSQGDEATQQHEVLGFVRGTDVGCSSPQPMSAEREHEIYLRTQERSEELGEQSAKLVGGISDEVRHQYQAWESADGSVWVQVIPLNDSAIAVVFIEEPVVVELLPDPALGRGGSTRHVDVVVIPR